MFDVTLFGLVWLIITSWCFIKKDIKYMFSITLLFMAFQSCNVFYLGELGIGPGILTSLLFVIKTAIRSAGKLHYYKKDRFLLILMYLLILFVFFSSAMNGTIRKQLMLIFQLLGYILCFTCINFVKRELDTETVYHTIRSILIFLSVVGLIQFLTTSGILPLRSVLEPLFYNDPSTDVVFHKSHYTRVMSTFMEPSYYAGISVGGFYYLLSLQTKWKKNAWLLLLLLIEIILTKSSTAYGAFFIVGILFFLFAKNIGTSWKITGIVVAGIGFCIVFFMFYDLLDAVIFSKDTTGSFSTRTRMNNRALQAFESSMLYGVGYKNCRGSSIVYSLLGELGIIGLSLYAVINATIIVPTFKNKKGLSAVDHYTDAARFAVLSAFICQIIACPDLDLCTYWFWLYCFGSLSLPSQSVSTKTSKRLTNRMVSVKEG